MQFQNILVDFKIDQSINTVNKTDRLAHFAGAVKYTSCISAEE